jgi:hypothetical protein
MVVHITLPSLFQTKLTKLGHRWPCEMIIKEEPKSLGRVMTRKHKAYLTTNANPIQPAGKRAKTASVSTSHV